MEMWNPWHGCHKISPGCANCYVYRRDAEFGKNTEIVTKTKKFDYPVWKNRKMDYKLKPDGDMLFTCGTSDFFIEEADEWRLQAWGFIKERADLHFLIVTKRIGRFHVGLPDDWGRGYENVTIGCTCENQNRADYRLPIFLEAPIKHRIVVHEPMLEEIHIEPYLRTGKVEKVICGGESGDGARLCDYAWIITMMNQCVECDVAFHFKQTGSLFKRGNKVYHIERKDQMTQARKADVDYPKGGNSV